MDLFREIVSLSVEETVRQRSPHLHANHVRARDVTDVKSMKTRREIRWQLGITFFVETTKKFGTGHHQASGATLHCAARRLDPALNIPRVILATDAPSALGWRAFYYVWDAGSPPGCLSPPADAAQVASGEEIAPP